MRFLISLLVLSCADDHFSRSRDDNLFMLQVGTDVKKGRRLDSSTNVTNKKRQPFPEIPTDESKPKPISNSSYASNCVDAKGTSCRSENVYLWSMVYAGAVALLCVIVGHAFARDSEHYLRTLFWLWLFIWSTGVIILVGKSAMAKNSFHYPLELVFLQRLSSAIPLLAVLYMRRNVFEKWDFLMHEIPKYQLVIFLFWACIPHTAEGIFKIITVQHCSIAFHLIAVNVCAPVIFIFAVLFGMESYTHVKMLALMTVCLLSVAAADGSLYYDRFGVIAAALDQTSLGSKLIAQEAYMKGNMQIDPATMFLIASLFSAVGLAPAVFWNCGGVTTCQWIPSLIESWDLVLVNVVISFLMGLSFVHLQNYVVPGELLLLSTSRSIILFVFSYVIFGDAITIQEAVGYTLSLVVLLIYGCLKDASIPK